MTLAEAKAKLDLLERQSLELRVKFSEKMLSVLTSKSRKALHPSSFVFPKDKRYPIHDLAHARNALARSSGKPEEAKVKSAVYKKYPALKARASK